MVHTFTLRKSERLNSAIVIEQLFKKGKHIYAYPLSVTFATTDTPGVAILCSVAKKRFRHAVDRNRVKRLMRESFRLNRHLLDSVIEQQGLMISFTITSTELPTFERMNKAITKALTHIALSMTSNNEQEP